MENTPLNNLTKLTPPEAEMLLAAVKFYLTDRMSKYTASHSDFYLSEITQLIQLKDRLELLLAHLIR